MNSNLWAIDDDPKFFRGDREAFCKSSELNHRYLMNMIFNLNIFYLWIGKS